MDTVMINRGDFGFSDYKGGGFFGFLARCIRFFSKSKWSHTFAIPLIDQVVGHIVEEAGPKGVVCTGVEKYLDPKEYFVEFWRPINVLPENIDKGVHRIWSMMGVNYGYFQLLGFVLVWVWYKITLRKANNPFRGGIICSELVLEYLKVVYPNEEVFKKMDRNTTSPEDIYEVLLARPDLFGKVI